MNKPDAHRLWIRQQRERYPFLPDENGTVVHEMPACGGCGCLGNNECGHECLDGINNCTLFGEATCPCCMIEGRPMTDAQHDRMTGQAQLF